MTDPTRISRDQPFVIELFTHPRKRKLTLAGLLVLLLAAYSGWWFWLEGEIRAHIANWQGSERAYGRDVTYEALNINGFPGPLQVQMLALGMRDQRAGYTFAVPAIDGVVSPWQITSMDGRLSGPVVLEIVRGDAPERFLVSFADNGFRVSIEKGGQADLTAFQVRAERLSDGERLTAESLNLTAARGTLPSFGSLTLNAAKIVLPAETRSPFGDQVERLAFRIDAQGALPPPGPIRDQLRAWTADGGTLEILTFDLAHGALGIRGEGTMALDQDLQPIGAFTARISGFNAAVDALVKARIVRPQDGALARVILGALAKAPQGGGPKIVEVPLSVQDRRLSVGPVPLMRLPRIRWE